MFDLTWDSLHAGQMISNTSGLNSLSTKVGTRVSEHVQEKNNLHMIHSSHSSDRFGSLKSCTGKFVSLKYKQRQKVKKVFTQRGSMCFEKPELFASRGAKGCLTTTHLVIACLIFRPKFWPQVLKSHSSIAHLHIYDYLMLNLSVGPT